MFAPLSSPFAQPLIPGQRYDPHTYLELAHARNLGLTVSGSPSLEPCQNGIGYRSSGTNKFSTSIDFGAGSGSPTLSIYVVTVFTLLSNSGRDIFIGGVDFPWELENNSGTLRAYFNGNYQTLETAIIGKLYTSVWTSRANNNDIAQYLNGSKVLSATAALTGLRTFMVGEGYPGYALGNTLIHRVYVGRGRSLSDDEAIALSLNPWGQVAPYRRDLVGDFAAAGGAGTAPGATVQSTSSITPGAATGASVVAAAASSAGTATPTGVGASVVAAAASSAGTAIPTGVGASVVAAAASSAGTATPTGVGASVVAAIGTSAGTSTVGGTSADFSIGSGEGTTAGVSTVSGVGNALVATTAASAGTGTVDGVGQAIAAATGTAAGVSTVSGVAPGESVGSGVAAAEGVATVAAIGVTINTSVGAVAGVSTSAAIGGIIIAAVGSAFGSAAASSSAVVVSGAVGSSDSTSSASAGGITLATGVGAAVGAGIAAGVAQSVWAGVGVSAGGATAVGYSIAPTSFADFGAPLYITRRAQRLYVTRTP